MFKLNLYKTLGKLTAAELIDSARIVKTRSDDYLIRVGEYDLDLTDDYDLCVSSYGTGICIMTLAEAETEKMEALHRRRSDLQLRQRLWLIRFPLNKITYCVD